MCFYILIIVIDYCIVDNGVDGKWGTENHPFQCFASAQGNVCLSVGESGAGVNNGVFKSQSLAFMNSDAPCQFYRVLLEDSFLFLAFLVLGWPMMFLTGFSRPNKATEWYASVFFLLFFFIVLCYPLVLTACNLYFIIKRISSPFQKAVSGWTETATIVFGFLFMIK